jgi:SRSO17 transposase
VGQWHRGWLIGERPQGESTGDRAYYWSDFPSTTPLDVLVEYAHRRHPIERYHQDAKDELGWDEYQGRLWFGFHRHAALIMLSYSFLVWQEWQQRHQQPVARGRPRGAFPLGRIVAAAHWRRSTDRCVKSCCFERLRN